MKRPQLYNSAPPRGRGRSPDGHKSPPPRQLPQDSHRSGSKRKRKCGRFMWGRGQLYLIVIVSKSKMAELKEKRVRESCRKWATANEKAKDIWPRHVDMGEWGDLRKREKNWCMFRKKKYVLTDQMGVWDCSKGKSRERLLAVVFRQQRERVTTGREDF
jgi:hypothetical protein